MRRFAVAGCLALLAMLSWTGEQSQAQQQAHLLKEKLEVGTVRMVFGQRVMDTSLTLYPGTEYAQTSRSMIEKGLHIEEWVTGMDSGRVSEVVRSYRTIDLHDTSWVGEQKFRIPGIDWKAKQTFAMKVKADGSREISHEVYDTIGAGDRAYVQMDTDVDLLPGREVKVGESWKVTKEKLGRVALATHADKLDSADVSVRLDSVKPNDAGEMIAAMTVSAKLKGSLKVINEFDGSVMTNLTSDVTFNGTASFNVTRGGMVRYEWNGEISVRGTYNAADASASATFAEANDYAYATVLDRKADNGKDGPDAPKEVQTFKHGAVDAGHILIARNGSGVARIQVFDPAARKIVKTVLAMPGSNSINTMALSPDRKRVAFSSNLNSLISVADADVFVLELESGKINQVTPGWADNNGIAQPINTGKTCTVTGRIVWYDDDPQLKRDRNDGFTGIVRFDHTSCVATVGADGKFTLTGVPVGTPLLLNIHGRLPAYSNGKMRDGLQKYAGMTNVDMVLDESGKNLGDVRIHPNHPDTRYDRPSWDGDSLWVNASAWTRSYKIGYPKHSWAETDFGGKLELLLGGFSVSRDGKHAAQCRDSSGGGGAVHVYGIGGKSVFSAEIPGATLSYSSEGAWTADGNWACTAGIDNTMGKNLYGAPGLVVAQVAQKQAGLYRAWPQLSGHMLVSLALNETSTVGYLVTHKFVAESQSTFGDAWAWDATTDTMIRLTSLGDVICVASYGR